MEVRRCPAAVIESRNVAVLSQRVVMAKTLSQSADWFCFRKTCEVWVGICKRGEIALGAEVSEAIACKTLHIRLCGRLEAVYL